MNDRIEYCHVCGTSSEISRHFYKLDNGDFVCSKKCFNRYALDYLNPVRYC